MSPRARKLAGSRLEVDCALSMVALADLIDRAVDRVQNLPPSRTGHDYRAVPIASSANDINFALSDVRTGRRVMSFRFLMKQQSGRVLLSSSISDYRTGATGGLGGKRMLGHESYLAIINDIARAIIAADITARAYLDDGTHATPLSGQYPGAAAPQPPTVPNGPAPRVPGHFPGAVAFDPLPPPTGFGTAAPTGHLMPPQSGALITAIPGRPAPTPQAPPTPSAPRGPSAPRNWLGSGVDPFNGPAPEPNTTANPETVLAQPPSASGRTRGGIETEWHIELDDGQHFPLVGTALLGRDPGSGEPGTVLIPLNDQSRTVSKTHAQIHVEGNDAIITDLGSTNGTSLGSSHPLTAGQSVRVTGTTEVSLGKYRLRLVRNANSAQ